MYEQVCYKKSYLKQVIARIDFAAPVEKLEKGPPTKLLGAIVKSFPIVEPTEVVMQEIELGAAGLAHKQTPIKQWNYYSKERDRQLALSPGFMYVLYNTYQSYEETRGQFQNVVDALTASFPDTIASRLGLRYVNQLNLATDDPTQWKQYVHENLAGARDLFQGEDVLTRLLSVAELRYGDIGVRFQYGMPNLDFPAPIKRPLFVLDIDASVSEAHELSKTMGFMDEAHARAQSIFERSITNALREKMDAVPVQP